MRWLRRLLLAAVAVELVYLVVANLALSLPLTQDIANRIRPEKFAVRWERAWTFVPFRVHVRGVSANGQNPRQQWQFATPEGSFWFSPWALISKTIRFHDVRVGDIDYRQRPRPRADRDYGDIRPYFPDIENRELETEPPAPVPRKKGEGWRFAASGVDANGRHRFWILNFRGEVVGRLSGDMSYRTRGGPFSIDDGLADIEVQSVSINDEEHVSGNGFLRGSFSFSPFVPAQNRGTRSLAFLTLDANLALESESLAYVNFYLGRFRGLHLDGSGTLSGDIRYDRGQFLPGTGLEVAAPDLVMQLSSLTASGEGRVELSVSPDLPDKAALEIEFGQLRGELDPGDHLLFEGENLVLRADASPGIKFDGTRPETGAISIEIPEVTVPDVSTYQAFIPARFRTRLVGGSGVLSAATRVNDKRIESRAVLTSPNADIEFNDYELTSAFKIVLNLAADNIDHPRFDVSGSSWEFMDTNVQTDRDKSDAVHSTITVDKGVLSIDLPDGESLRSWLESTREKGSGSLMEVTDVDLDMTGDVSSLDWINLFLRNPDQVSVGGAGKLHAKIRLDDGNAVAGSRIDILPRDLSVSFLDYVASGDGDLAITVEQVGDDSQLGLDVGIRDGRLGRQAENGSFARDIALDLSARARSADGNGQLKDFKLDLSIPSGRIEDMRVYNDYLPENSPLVLTGGEAEIRATLSLDSSTAAGNIRLETTGLRSRIEDQDLAAELTAEINIAGGDPTNMRFDVSGTNLQIDRVNIAGEALDFDTAAQAVDDEPWTANIVLDHANVNWKKPVSVEIDSSLRMTDTAPFVTMLANHRGEHGWIGKLLSVEDVTGGARISIDNREITIPLATVTGGDIGVSAKGFITSSRRDGMVFAHYKALKGLLKIDNGERNFDVINTRKRFDNYLPGQPVGDRDSRSGEPATNGTLPAREPAGR